MPLTPFLIVFFVFAGLCVLLALSQGFAMRRRWRERRRFAASHRLVWLLVFLLLGTLSGLLGSALLGYRRLTSETVLADLSARQLEPRRFAVRIDYPDGSRRSVEVFGLRQRGLPAPGRWRQLPGEPEPTGWPDRTPGGFCNRSLVARSGLVSAERVEIVMHDRA